MSIKELNDLKSKLLLITGKDSKYKDDVRHFVESITAVENLTRAFLNLLKSGCMLFNNWRASIM